MASRTFHTPAQNTLTVRLEASSIELAVEAVEGLTEASLELTGPSEVVEATTATTPDRYRWHITLPAAEPTVTRYGNAVFTNHGGATIIQGRDMVMVNGRVVSGVEKVIRSEPVRATLRIPTGSTLHTTIEDGSVRTHGTLMAITHQGANASLSVEQVEDIDADTLNGDLTVRRATSTANLSSLNGSIQISRTGPRTRASSTNGDIRLVGGWHGNVHARTINGDVSVVRNGYTLDVHASTVNGYRRIHD